MSSDYEEMREGIEPPWRRSVSKDFPADPPPADPGQEIPEAMVKAAAEVLYRDYASQYQADHLSWLDFADLAREALASALSKASVATVHAGDVELPAGHLHVKVTIEDARDEPLWSWYPLPWVDYGQHVHIDFPVQISRS